MWVYVIMSGSAFFFRNGTSTIVTSVFGGILQNEVYCLICGTESRKFDPFLGEPSVRSIKALKASVAMVTLNLALLQISHWTFPANFELRPQKTKSQGRHVL